MSKDNLPYKESEVLIEVQSKPDNQLILFNDEVNTFDFVIESLVDICNHDRVQAEQCSMIVHYNGKCAVQSGSTTELKPMCSALHDRGLSASIE